MRSRYRHLSLILIAAVATLSATASAIAQVEPAEAERTSPVVSLFDYKRMGSPAFSFLLPSLWVPLGADGTARARLEYVANLREVLDAPPDVPPGSYDRLLSFAAYFIPEVNGYLLATVFDTNPFPVQLLDVLHEHAKGSNDWGRSLYISVEQVLRNERFDLDGNPTLVVDVHMSDKLTIAAQYFRVPSSYNRTGGIILLLPSDSWDALQPLVNHIRESIRIGVSNEPPQTSAMTYPIVEVDENAHAASPDMESGDANPNAKFTRPWVPKKEDATLGMTIGRLTSRLLVVAVAYAGIFFITLRLIYGCVILLGTYFLPHIDLESYRRNADANPWTMGLLTSERMIMLCALASMALAGVLLGILVQT